MGWKLAESSSGDMQMKREEASLSSMAAASGGKLSKSSSHIDTSSSCHVRPADLAKKRKRSKSELNCRRYFEEDQEEEASGSSRVREMEMKIWVFTLARTKNVGTTGMPLFDLNHQEDIVGLQPYIISHKGGVERGSIRR
ncbi:Hypothetical predicted protein [Olea europaea subsp. europaea]|uniref:Uncharacterized protein n=1 Tax=Olea europaea subsp. europaea TaxID=158383 RepID=A0A8S0RFV7_OLEEU|nr:Hypothetical predicted protein [Olea europaea subsp. europaea]